MSSIRHEPFSPTLSCLHLSSFPRKKPTDKAWNKSRLCPTRTSHPTDGMPLHPVQPIPPLFFTDGAAPTCLHTGAFGNENRQALAQSIVGAVAQPLSVGVGIKVECIHYIAISGNRIVRCQMDVLVPMRTTNEDNGIRFYGTNRLDNLHRVCLHLLPTVFHRFVENLIDDIRNPFVTVAIWVKNSFASSCRRLWLCQSMMT